MASKPPGTSRLVPTATDFRRLFNSPSLAALQDFNPDLYLTVAQIVGALVLLQSDMNARVLRLEQAPGVVIPDPPDVLSIIGQRIKFGFTTLSSGTVTVLEPAVRTDSIIVPSYRGTIGATGALSAPFSGMTAGASFKIDSRDPTCALVTGDNSEVAWVLFNPLA